MAPFSRSADGIVIEGKSPLAWRFAAALRVMHGEMRERNKSFSLQALGRAIGLSNIGGTLCATWMPVPQNMKQKWRSYFLKNAPQTYPFYKPLFDAHIDGGAFPPLSPQEAAAMPPAIRKAYEEAGGTFPSLTEAVPTPIKAEEPPPLPVTSQEKPLFEALRDAVRALLSDDPEKRRETARTQAIPQYNIDCLYALSQAFLSAAQEWAAPTETTPPAITERKEVSADPEPSRREREAPTALPLNEPLHLQMPLIGTPEAAVIGKEIRAIAEHHGFGPHNRPELARLLNLTESSLNQVLSGNFVPSVKRRKGLLFWQSLQTNLADGFKTRAVKLKPLMEALNAYLAEHPLKHAPEAEASPKEKALEKKPEALAAPRLPPAAAQQKAPPRPKPASAAKAAIGLAFPKPETVEARALGLELKNLLWSNGYTGKRAMDLLGIHDQTYFSDLLAGREVLPFGTARCREILGALREHCEGYAQTEWLRRFENEKTPLPDAKASFRQAADSSMKNRSLMTSKPAPLSPLAREIGTAFYNIFDHHNLDFLRVWKSIFKMKNPHALRRIIIAEDTPTPRQMKRIYLPLLEKHLTRGLQKFGARLYAYAEGKIAFTPKPSQKQPANPVPAAAAASRTSPSVPHRWSILDHYPQDAAQRVLDNLKLFLDPARLPFQRAAEALTTSATCVKNIWLGELSFVPSAEDMVKMGWPEKLPVLNPDAIERCFALKKYWADALHPVRNKDVPDFASPTPESTDCSRFSVEERKKIKKAPTPFYQRAAHFIVSLASSVEDCGVTLAQAFGESVWNGIANGDGAEIPPATYCEMIERVCRLACVRTNQPATTEGKIARFLLDEGQEIATKSGSPVSAPAPH